ncbi:hypothetical protein WK13_34750 [Burkholderia ubonensis]|uniref:hypothetical protein n=1 Tax=Burkholderia ubonensis TaxID=101571 RepID=UPI00075DBF7D|nr:hypothetical protein [Burkholderia ubonensis]KVR21700.1 hypothetical protein WK13_34750 [Burkholderia ubonensis]
MKAFQVTIANELHTTTDIESLKTLIKPVIRKQRWSVSEKDIAGLEAGATIKVTSRVKGEGKKVVITVIDLTPEPEAQKARKHAVDAGGWVTRAKRYIDTLNLYGAVGERQDGKKIWITIGGVDAFWVYQADRAEALKKALA